MNRGKQFEQVIREAFEKLQYISIDRLPDPMGGYLGVRNICDFVIYKYPFQLYLECKVQQGNTLNWARITENQWQGLQTKSLIFGIIAGVLVWFIDHDITTFVPIQELTRLKEAGQKSLKVQDLQSGEVEHIALCGRKKRVFFDYDVKRFLAEISLFVAGYWVGEMCGGEVIE